MWQTLVVVVFGGNTGLFQGCLHYIGIVSERVLFAAGKIGWGIVLVVVGGQSGEDIAVLGVDPGVSIEDVHGLFVDDGNSFLILVVGLVYCLVL